MRELLSLKKWQLEPGRLGKCYWNEYIRKAKEFATDV